MADRGARPVSKRVISVPSTCELLPASCRYPSLTTPITTPLSKCSNLPLLKICSRRPDITMMCRRTCCPGSDTVSTSLSLLPAPTGLWTTSVSAWRMTFPSLQSDRTFQCQVKLQSPPVRSCRPQTWEPQTSAAARSGQARPPTPAHPSSTVRGTGAAASVGRTGRWPPVRGRAPSSTSSHQCNSHT